jgi:multidrug efflux pump subunit AcrA (membrane-fusion protein)
LWLETEKLDEAIRETQLGLELGRLSIELARLELDTLQASVPLDLRGAKRAKEIADRNLQHFLKTDEQLRRRDANEQLKSIQDMLEGSQEELKQLEKMYKADDLTEETEEIILKRAKRDVERAQYLVDKQRINHERSLSEAIPREKELVEETAQRASLSLAKAEATLPRSVDQKRLELQKLESAQQEAQQKYERLRADRQEMVVTAPLSGYIYYGQCDRGRWTAASAGKPLRKGATLMPLQVALTVVAPSPAFVRLDVPEKDLKHLKVGMPAVVSPTGFDETLAGKLAALEPIPIKDGVFDARVTYGGGPQILPGMSCTVRITSYSKADALTVPNSAVFSDDLDEAKKYVLLSKQGATERRDVKIGPIGAEKTEILDGLQPGDVVLTKKPEEKAGS